ETMERQYVIPASFPISHPRICRMNPFFQQAVGKILPIGEKIVSLQNKYNTIYYGRNSAV
ncbi:MAG: hypothetical protein K6A67_01885, partial [Bacteroidales bacterium]|nr:hypothetical protein [Bacteroidales bacterium]